MDDKAVEHARYDARARRTLDAGEFGGGEWGSSSVPLAYRAPYLCYEALVRRLLRPGLEVLELGAGAGLHTKALLDSGANVTATDISDNSLALLTKRLGPSARERLETRQADIESLPFGDSSFDVVVSAGALSYGAPGQVDAEVRRVLRRGGSFLCVDSLNHNPVYRLNRWIHFLQGERTRSTLLRMPTEERIAGISAGYARAEVRYFGGASWLLGPLAPLVGPERAARWSDALDAGLHVRRSAFKFVLLAQDRA